MIQSEKFDSQANAFRSSLISPIFTWKNDSLNFCMSFAYNLNTRSNDGFDLLIENYLNSSESQVLVSKRGPYKIDRWYYEAVNVSNLELNQFRVN
jgi:hypothetical protein